jgi:hypothetical protein
MLHDILSIAPALVASVKAILLDHPELAIFAALIVGSAGPSCLNSFPRMVSGVPPGCFR